jgi:hypothetical protein
MQLDGGNIHSKNAVLIHAAILDVFESCDELGRGIPGILYTQCLGGKHHAGSSITEDAGIVGVHDLLFGIASPAYRGKHLLDPGLIIFHDGLKTGDLVILLDNQFLDVIHFFLLLAGFSGRFTVPNPSPERSIKKPLDRSGAVV